MTEKNTGKRWEETRKKKLRGGDIERTGQVEEGGHKERRKEANKGWMKRGDTKKRRSKRGEGKGEGENKLGENRK